jgi:hypothetical protein
MSQNVAGVLEQLCTKMPRLAPFAVATRAWNVGEQLLAGNGWAIPQLTTLIAARDAAKTPPPRPQTDLFHALHTRANRLEHIKELQKHASRETQLQLRILHARLRQDAGDLRNNLDWQRGR